MKTTINSPLASKINWTALIMISVNFAVIFGYIPEEYEGPLVALVNTLGPALIAIFRTGFTDPKPNVGP